MPGFLCNGTRAKCMEKSGGVFESNLNKGIVYIYFKEEKKKKKKKQTPKLSDLLKVLTRTEQALMLL